MANNVISEIDYHLSVMDQLVSAAYATEISLAQTAFQNGDYSKCFYHLERAHILGQRSTVKHTYAHWLMFRVGVQQSDSGKFLVRCLACWHRFFFLASGFPSGTQAGLASRR
jgi:hypothetical protein